MLLSDRTIRDMVFDKIIYIEDFELARLQACSYDVKLAPTLKILRDGPFYMASQIDPRTEQIPSDPFFMDERGYYLEPGQMVLGSLKERVTLPSYIAARIEGKSSLGRLGIAPHIAAGFVDAGWDGYLTVEIKNHLRNTSILLFPDMLIGQLCFFDMSTAAMKPYQGKYQGATEAQDSRYHKNYE